MSFINIDVLKFEKKIKIYDQVLEGISKKVDTIEGKIEKKRVKKKTDEERIYISIAGLRRANITDEK